MRAYLTLGFLAMAGFSVADKLITVPTATKVSLNAVKLEGLWEQSRARTDRYSLGAGLTDAIDAFITGERREGGRMRNSFDVAYNVIPAVTGFGPGLSFGMQDALNNTVKGRRFFLAVTFKEGYADSVSGSVPAEVTIGTYFGSVNNAFIGVMLPFTDRFRGLAEYDGHKINAGFEFRPTNDIGLRATFEQKNVMIGAQVTLRF